MGKRNPLGLASAERAVREDGGGGGGGKTSMPGTAGGGQGHTEFVVTHIFSKYLS